jgi:Ni/Fe-hydrogenase 1 B-type cytochrome subunit
MATPSSTSLPRAAYRRVKVWEMPVRFYHWLNALCIAALSVTGYIIGTPFAISYG